jgi:aminoglycoside phosphotransferase (APT) family kinase protein
VFRTQKDFKTSGGRDIIIAEILEREKFFYDNINKKLGHICPEVYVVDGTREYHENAYQISEYIEGKNLSDCFRDDFDEQTKKDINYKIGEMAARINAIEIDKSHPYIASRSSWEDYMARRLYERLIDFVKFDMIKPDEINKIVNNMRNKKSDKTLSFLHLDMGGGANMIYNNGKIFLLDAENCEFGNPLHELAVIDVRTQGISPDLIAGYKSVTDIDISDLYYYCKLERLGLVAGLYIAGILNDTAGKEYYLKEFKEVKSCIL